MVLGVIFVVILGIVAVIWLLFGFKRIKHKLFAIVLIVLILFSFFSFNLAFKDQQISFSNVSDIGKIARVYLSWLGNIFGNIKTITGHAVEMDWRGNYTT